jgi:hypothetical protein
MNWKKNSILQQEKLQKEKTKLTYIVAFTHVNIIVCYTNIIRECRNELKGRKDSKL